LHPQTIACSYTYGFQTCIFERTKVLQNPVNSSRHGGWRNILLAEQEDGLEDNTSKKGRKRANCWSEPLVSLICLSPVKEKDYSAKGMVTYDKYTRNPLWIVKAT